MNEPQGTRARDADLADDERVARAGRLGRTVGTVIMVVFGTWFVLTTVYNFAVGVFVEK